jgi:glyoxylase-like metal-dependent hydrolase (beta-lactamase superfamily II)
VSLQSDGERFLLLGDAVTHPGQLSEPGWHSMGDVDAALAEHSRESLLRRLAEPGTSGVGAHFPELRHGRVVDGAWTPAV